MKRDEKFEDGGWKMEDGGVRDRHPRSSIFHPPMFALLAILLACLTGCHRSNAEASSGDRESSPRIKAYLDMPATPGGRLPMLLSQVGAFADVARLKPIPGLLPYDINAAFWSDGARKQRWIGLPQGKTI